MSFIRERSIFAFPKPMTVSGKRRPNDFELSVRKATNKRFLVEVWELEHRRAQPDRQRRTVYYQTTLAAPNLRPSKPCDIIRSIRSGRVTRTGMPPLTNGPGDFSFLDGNACRAGISAISMCGLAVPRWLIHHGDVTTRLLTRKSNAHQSSVGTSW